MAERGDPDAWARLRFAVVGPLLASPPEGRELGSALAELARTDWTHPSTGLPVRFGASTIERWYYVAKNAADPVGALRRRVRADKGRTRVLDAALATLIRAQHAEHPGWTAQLHHDNLAVLVAADPSALGAMPSYSTLRRFLRANGLDRRRTPARASAGAARARDRLERLETRSFEASHAHGLWHLDFHHGSRRVLEPDGRWIKPYLLGIVDDHTRLVCHLQWYRDEGVGALVHGLSQAIAKRALPRALMSDNGAAMVAAELVEGLHALGIVHERTLPASPQQNGKQESFWGNVEGRFMAMLEAVPAIGLDELNRLTQVWVEGDYHRKVHSEIAATPLGRYLDAPSVGRAAPDALALRRAFRQRGVRRQRKSDGTLSLAGRRFEVPGRFGHLERVHVAWARWNLAEVDLIDADTAAVVAPLHPLDREANAGGRRRARTGPAESVTCAAAAVPGEAGALAPLMAKLVAEFVATGLPPGFAPSPGARERDEDRIP